MLPDLVSLAIFVRAVEANSLSKAAEQSHIALAAASRRITLLEQRYGVQLLYRSPQGVHVTPAGQTLARHARQMLEQAKKLQVDLSDYAKGIKGHIRIQAHTSAITQFLPRQLSLFARKHPDVKLDLQECRSIEIAQALREGKADIGVIMDGPWLDGLTTYEYQRDRLVAVVPRGHEIRARQVAFEELVEYDLVTLDSSAAMMRLLQEAAAHAGQPLRLRMQVKSFDSVCKLVQAGMRIGVLPHDAALNLASAMGLRLVQLTNTWATRRMFVCIRDPAHLAPVCRMLIEQMIQHPRVSEMRKQAQLNSNSHLCVES
jgi:DNA-binding transcriptional LysR family regulator